MWLFDKFQTTVALAWLGYVVQRLNQRLLRGRALPTNYAYKYAHYAILLQVEICIVGTIIALTVAN